MDGLEVSSADLDGESLSVLMLPELEVREELVGDAAGMDTPSKT